MTAPRPEVAEAVDTLLRADPARIVALVASLRGPDRLLESTVAGMSMGQGLPAGSRIRIAFMDRARYDVGEVVAFLGGNQVTVHRVVHRGRAGAAAGQVLTRGDAPLVPDPPVEQERILGPVTAVWREDRWTELSGAARRSFRARIVAWLVLQAAIGTLYLSPRATAGVLTLLGRAERALRFAMARGSRRQTPVAEPR